MATHENHTNDEGRDRYKGYIPTDASLIGKSLGELREKTRNTISIFPLLSSRVGLIRMDSFNKRTRFNDRMGIELSGEWEDICRFTEEYGLP